MARSLFGRLRRLWLDVHLWIGVGLLAALIPVGLSGSLLVWHAGLERAVFAHRYEVTGPPSQPASAYITAARAAFGDRATAASLRMPREPGDPVTVVGRMAGEPAANGRPRQLTAWIDPATARVLDVANIRDGVFSVMHRLHGSLLIPEVGRKVVGWLGWAMTVSCLTGLWLWWPRNGAVLKAMRWRRSPSFLTNLHHMFGLWIMIPLLVVSLTGVYISFPQTARALFGVAEPGQGAARGPRQADPPPLAAPNLSADAAVERAQAVGRGAALAGLELPAEGREPRWTIELETGRFSVDDATGEAAAAPPEPRRGGRDPTSRLMRQIHDGADTPLVWQVLVFLTGLAPPLLGTSGLVMWLRRRRRRRLIRRGHDAAAA